MRSLPEHPASAVTGETASLKLFDENRAKQSPEEPPKTFGREQIFSFLTQAALVFGLLGFGWALSGQFLDSSTSKDAPRAQSGAKTEQTQITALSGEIASLKEAVEATRAAAKNQNGDEVRALKKSLDSVRAGLEAVKAETNSTIAQLGTKFDHAQHEPAAKLQQIADRLDRIEKQVVSNSAASGSSTAAKSSSHPLPAAPVQKIGSTGRGSSIPETVKPFPLINNWVVRDVYDGIALVEGEYGAIQVAPGENIPGAGRVKSIEKRGSGWIVITSRGFVDSAHD